MHYTPGEAAACQANGRARRETASWPILAAQVPAVFLDRDRPRQQADEPANAGRQPRITSSFGSFASMCETRREMLVRWRLL